MRAYVYGCVINLDKTLEGERLKMIIWMGKYCLIESSYENTTF